MIASKSLPFQPLRTGLAAMAIGGTLLAGGQTASARPKMMHGMRHRAMGAPMHAPMAQPDPEMQAVLDQLAALHGKPIEKLTPTQARKQPGPPDAVKALLEKQGKSTAPEAVGSVENKTIPGPYGKIPVRIYKPKGNGPFPVLVYTHGGGWVIASIQAYDSSCRALTNAAKCMVISVGYHLAPEHRLPVAQEEAYSATQWVMKHVAGWGGDPSRVAVGGESAGGNLATETCLLARARHGRMPIYQLLVYPVTNYNFNTPSYWENAKAKPLNRPMMKWFFRYALRSSRDGRRTIISPLRANLHGLPPATIIQAQIDPLRSEGAAYAQRLRNAGVPVRQQLYTGVTHEFFGMGAVVSKAKQAVAFAAAGLQSAFAK